MNEEPGFEGILQIAFGFWASKALLTAVEVGLFTELAKGPPNPHPPSRPRIAFRVQLPERQSKELGEIRRLGVGAPSRKALPPIALFLTTDCTDYTDWRKRNKKRFSHGDHGEHGDKL